MNEPDTLTLARRIRARVLAELERAWEEAATQGLCGEGAHEYAIDRVRHLDPADLVSEEAPVDRSDR